MYERLYNTVTRFARNHSGNFAMLAAVVTPIFVFSVGSSIDIMRLIEARNKAQAAVDGASLAAASNLSRIPPVLGNSEEARSQREEISVAAAANAEQFVQLNLASLTGGSQSSESAASDLGNSNSAGSDAVAASSSPVTDIDFEFSPQAGTVSIGADISVPTTFARIFGFDELTTSVSSTSSFVGTPEADRNVEFAFVLDVTGSMARNGRIDALKEAMRDSMDILLPAGGATADRIRVGLVPYSSGVNVGRQFYPSATFQNPVNNNRRATCVIERRGELAFDDVVPELGENDTRYNRPIIRQNGFFRFIDCPRTQLRPLTNNRQALLNDIDSLTAEGLTAGHAGVNWGINVLSEEWQSFWPTGSKPADYVEVDADDNPVDARFRGNDAELPVRKVMVVMSDGSFNRDHYGNSDRERLEEAVEDGKIPELDNDAPSALAASKFCSLAKDKSRDIEVYTIAFQADEDAQQLLKSCATPDDPDSEDILARGPHFFNADSGEDLQAAFRSIAAGEVQILLVN